VPPELSPVCLIRVDLRQPAVAGQEERVRPFAALWDPAAVDSVAIGVNRSGGSPSTWRAGGGRTLVFTNAERFEEGCFRPVIFAVQDKAGVLSPQWWCLLDVDPGDGIHAAPAFHEDSRTLLVTTTRSIFVFHGADQLEGEVPCPEPIDPASLLAGVAPSRGWEVWAGSPFALSFDEVSGDIVGYTNLRLTRGRGGPSWSYMGAFVLPIGKGGFPRPLWSFPLATPDGGLNAQGPGTFGQPALFLYESERGCSVGMAVTSVRTGTYVVR
jgi:hypothetical protein